MVEWLNPGWIERFVDSGGDILWAILAVTVLLWTLIVERLWFYRLVFPRRARAWRTEWAARTDHRSWYARAIRGLIVSRANEQLRSGLPMIRCLIALCPLLGLLGTVTGMIEVFDAIALEGTSNARAMASGVSHATIPTMAGMVAALSGLYFRTHFPQRAERETRRLADNLTTHGDPR